MSLEKATVRNGDGSGRPRRLSRGTNLGPEASIEAWGMVGQSKRVQARLGATGAPHGPSAISGPKLRAWSLRNSDLKAIFLASERRCFPDHGSESCPQP